MNNGTYNYISNTNWIRCNHCNFKTIKNLKHFKCAFKKCKNIECSVICKFNNPLCEDHKTKANKLDDFLNIF